MPIHFKIFLLSLTTIFFLSCQSSNKKDASVLSPLLQETVPANKVIENEQLNSMTAKINGKTWVATSMPSPETAGRIVGYYQKQYIGLPFNKTNMVAGKKIIIGEDEAADIFLDDGCSYPVTNGRIEITKVDKNSAEGKFFFTTTCSRTNKELKVTDGFFRIRLAK